MGDGLIISGQSRVSAVNRGAHARTHTYTRARAHLVARVHDGGDGEVPDVGPIEALQHVVVQRDADLLDAVVQPGHRHLLRHGGAVICFSFIQASPTPAPTSLPTMMPTVRECESEHGSSLCQRVVLRGTKEIECWLMSSDLPLVLSCIRATPASPRPLRSLLASFSLA